jgi:2-dehydropantoate 2-reductase
MTSVAVLGPGGVGGFIAAALERAGEDVVVVAREETAATIEREGIQVTSVRLGDFTAHPATATELATAPDLLVVATKATTLDEALSRVSAPPRLVVPLLNGLDHIAHLREVLDPGTVAAGAIRIESDRPEPGVVVQTSPFLRVDLAADQDPPRSALGSVATMFERAGIPVEIGSSEAQILWSKLVRLNALALTTSAADRPIGFIRSDPQWREALIGCITEATAVANADGAEMDAGDRIGELDAAHAELRSSMQRDIAAGRPPELDAIAGAVLRAGARHGLACPTVARLAVAVAERAGIDPPLAAS